MEATGVFLPTHEKWSITSSLERTKKRVVYCDALGQPVEKDVPRTLINEAMMKAKWPSISIARSTGGFSPAQAIQLVVMDPAPQDPLVVPSFRIKVSFTELLVAGTGPEAFVRYERLTKDVTPSEVIGREPFTLGFPQGFVLDLGQGPVPIHVFDFGVDWSGTPTALFVEIDDLKELMTGTAGERRFLWAYQVRLDAVRHLDMSDPTGFKNQYQQAYANYYVQKTSGKFFIPRCMQVGSRVQIPCGVTYDEIEVFLRNYVKYEKP